MENMIRYWMFIDFVSVISSMLMCNAEKKQFCYYYFCFFFAIIENIIWHTSCNRIDIDRKLKKKNSCSYSWELVVTQCVWQRSVLFLCKIRNTFSSKTLFEHEKWIFSFEIQLNQFEFLMKVKRWVIKESN